MNARTLLLCFVFLAGCFDRVMTNDQVIAEVKKCEKAGMRAQQIQSAFALRTVRINCVVKP